MLCVAGRIGLIDGSLLAGQSEMIDRRGLERGNDDKNGRGVVRMRTNGMRRQGIGCAAQVSEGLTDTR